MVIYVDDLIIFALCALASAVLATIRKVWELSQPEWISDAGPVKFCGLEICRFNSGYRVNQQSYIAEILLKHDIKDDAAVPLTRWSEPETDEQPSPEEVKSAQAITGALLWLSTRSRPGHCVFGGADVTVCDQVSKACSLYWKPGTTLLAWNGYFGLEYHDKVQHDWASHGQLPKLRDDSLLKLYSDDSHGPSGGRSMQASIVLWRGCLILWEATRQPFVTLSSAESELVSMVNTIGQGEAMQMVVEELLETSTHLLLLGDNAASVRSFEIADASWRNRHLRLRAASGHEKVEAGILTVAHLPGEFQVADLATKPLPRQRLLQLLDLASVRMRSEDTPVLSRVRARRRMIWENLDRIVVSPATLLVIVMLSSPVPAKAETPLRVLVAIGSVCSAVAQPDILEARIGVFMATCGLVVLIALVILGWFYSLGTTLGFRNSVQRTVERQNPGEQEPLDPLREREERTGLTLVQRAKLRKQLQEGGIVDPPIMYQRYGSLPPWLIDNRLGQEQQEPQVQDGGSTANRFKLGGALEVQTRCLWWGGGQPSALPTLAADRRNQISETEGFPRPSSRGC